MFHCYLMLFCPRNFPSNHRAPQVMERGILEIRKSDTIDEKGIAIVDGYAFPGWIEKDDLEKVMGQWDLNVKYHAKIQDVGVGNVTEATSQSRVFCQLKQ